MKVREGFSGGDAVLKDKENWKGNVGCGATWEKRVQRFRCEQSLFCLESAHQRELQELLNAQSGLFDHS